MAENNFKDSKRINENDISRRNDTNSGIVNEEKLKSLKDQVILNNRQFSSKPKELIDKEMREPLSNIRNREFESLRLNGRNFSNNPNNELLYDPDERIRKRLGSFSAAQNNDFDEDEENDVENENVEDRNIDSEESSNDNNAEESTFSDEENTSNDEVRETAKNVAKKVVADKTKEVAAQAGRKLIAFLLKNPYVLAIIGIILVLLFLILIFMSSGFFSSNGSGKYDDVCNYNLTQVELNKCDTEETSTQDIDEYVINTAYKISATRNMSDESLKALMIILKTNALAAGNYDNTTKKVSINDCDIKALYTTDSDYNYTSNDDNSNKYISMGSAKGNGSFWWPIGSLNETSSNIYAGQPAATSISSGFGNNRGDHKHGGIDIPSRNQPVIASSSGTVIDANDGCTFGNISCGGRYGNRVYIDHGSGIVTRYAHMINGSIRVKVGQTVAQGQILGLTGNTGNTSGGTKYPEKGFHLHFEVRLNGVAQNPVNYVSASNPRPGGSAISNNDTENVTNNETANNSTNVTSNKDLQSIYLSIEDYLFLDQSFNSSITTLDNSSILPLNNSVISQLEQSNTDYTSVLNSLYATGNTNNNNTEENNTQLSIIKPTIFIGDSRTQGMMMSGVISNSNTVAKVAQGYNWFNSTAINSANSMMGNNAHNIVIWLGVNDLANINNYFNKYKELAQNSWKNHNIYIVSVGPVDDLKAKYVKNSSINEFNNNMANLIKNSSINNLRFISINYSISQYDSEGLHYGASDYKNIYNSIMNGIGTGTKSAQLSGEYKLYNLADYCQFIDENSNADVYADNTKYWWPIGSSETTTENGVLFAKGTPTHTHVGSKFGMRLHPIQKVWKLHSGIDIGASANVTNVIAAMDGIVTYTNNTCASSGSNGCGGGAGNYIRVQDTQGNENVYMHLYRDSLLVKVGDKVKQGQVLAKVGSSGNSTGPHLHFTIKVNGVAVDPLQYVDPANPRPVKVTSNINYNGDKSQYKKYVCGALKSAGFSNNAVAAIMVNMQAESGIVPIRVQGDYAAGYAKSIAYTQQVDSGAISRSGFANGGPGGGGYGLVQWTSSGRKAGLYDHAKGKNLSIGDTGAQVEYFLIELQQKAYQKSYMRLQGNNSALDMATTFCLNFEAPKNLNSVCPARAASAVPAMLQYVNNGCN